MKLLLKQGIFATQIQTSLSNNIEMKWNCFMIRKVMKGFKIFSPLFTYLTVHCKPLILVSDTIHVMCVNFIRESRNIQFKVDFERAKFLHNFIWQFDLLSELLLSGIIFSYFILFDIP